KTYNEQFAEFEFSRALETAWSLIAAVNKYIVESEPWALAEKGNEERRSRLATTLYTSAEELRIVSQLLFPILPESATKIWVQLGLKASDLPKLNLEKLVWG